MTVYKSDNSTKYADVTMTKNVVAVIMLPPDTSYYVRQSDNNSTTSSQANPIVVTDGGVYTATVKATK